MLDTNNTIFHAKLIALFESAAFRIGSNNSPNVNVIKNGRTIIFQNPGKSFSQSIGVYKDGVKIESLDLGRYTYVSSSIPAAVNNLQNPPDPIETSPFTMQGDGNFEFRVRTGKPFTGINDVESQRARELNCIDLAIDNMGLIIQFIPWLSFNNSCIQQIRTFTAETYSGFQSILEQSGTNLSMFSAIMLQMASSTVSLIATSNSCFSSPANTGFLGFAAKFLKFQAVITTSIQIINSSISAKQFIESDPAFDTCFKVNGNTFSSCISHRITDPRDGQTYAVVQIGNQNWFAENLRYKGSIPQVSDQNLWAALPDTGQNIAWCYYDNILSNDTVYGKLYTWYAVNSGNLCPSGWHIPSDVEWQTLENYLGGPSVAGGKMKSTGTQYWLNPNAFATNESGFSGLPGSYREHAGSFNVIGSNGNWWSSTGNFTFTAWFHSLNYSNSSVTRDDYEKTSGMSCRCIQD